MEIESHLTRQASSPASLLRAALNQFGSYQEIASHFNRNITTVYHWKDRLPGKDIRQELQNYLPGQERVVHLTGEMRDSGRARDITITLNREDNIIYSGLLAANKTSAAEVFLLAAEHGEWSGAPALAGTEWNDEWWEFMEDYDNQQVDSALDPDYMII
jgi:hypothetical protein